MLGAFVRGQLLVMLALGVILILVVVFMRGGLWGGFSSLFERIKGSRKRQPPLQEEQP